MQAASGTTELTGLSSMQKAKTPLPSLEATVSAPRSVFERTDSGVEVPKEEGLTKPEVSLGEKKQEHKNRRKTHKKEKATSEPRDHKIISTTLVRLQFLGVGDRSDSSIPEGDSSSVWDSNDFGKPEQLTEKQKDKKKFGKKREQKAATKSNYLGIQADLKGLKMNCDSRGRKSLWLCHEVQATNSDDNNYVFEALLSPNHFLQVSSNGSSLETSKGRENVKREAIWRMEIDKKSNERRATVRLISKQFSDFHFKAVHKVIDDTTLDNLEHKENSIALQHRRKPKESTVRSVTPSELPTEEPEKKEELPLETETQPQLSLEELARRVSDRVEKKKFLKVERKHQEKAQSRKREKARSKRSSEAEEDF